MGFLLNIILLTDIILTKVVDTLSTRVPGVQVVLYEDNTWRFVRNGTASQMTPPRAWEALPLLLAEDDTHYSVPVCGNLSSSFGLRYGHKHKGVDIAVNTGTPIYAAFDGTVRVSGNMGGYGLGVTILHDNGLETLYGHLSRLKVKAGCQVRAGDVIGFSGNTGNSTGPHLHFETRFKGQPFNPERIFDFSSGRLHDRIFILKRPFLCITGSYGDEYYKGLFKNVEQKETSQTDGSPVYHTIVNGDNLSRLARKYDTTIRDICSLNEKITTTTILQLGWVVRVK